MKKAKNIDHFDNVVFNDEIMIYDEEGSDYIKFESTNNAEDGFKPNSSKFIVNASGTIFDLSESHKLIEFFTACIEKIASVHIEHRSKK